MFSFRSSVAVLLAVIASASAVSISQSCSKTLFNLALDSEASACLNAPALINAAINITNTKQDPIGTATKYLTGLCSSGTCSDNTIEKLLRNATENCKDDLQNLGINIDLTPNTLANIKAGYKTVRQVACLKDTSANELCVISSVKTAEKVLGQPQTLQAIMSAVLGDPSSVSTLIADAKQACTPCAKGAFTLAHNDFPSLVDQVKEPVSSVCGADFVNGQMPSNIQKTAASGTVAEVKAKASTNAVANGATDTFGAPGLQLASVGASVVLGALLFV